MSWSGVVGAGLVGTGVMTLLMALGPSMGMARMDMLGTLGTMFVPEGAAARTLGGVLHFGMGVVFAAVYGLLWRSGVGTVSPGWGLVFGAVHGIVAAAVMPAMRAMHPRRPELPTGSKAAMGIVLGHAVYGLVVAWVYGWVAGV